jgi:hypothetical protein
MELEMNTPLFNERSFSCDAIDRYAYLYPNALCLHGEGKRQPYNIEDGYIKSYGQGYSRLWRWNRNAEALGTANCAPRELRYLDTRLAVWSGTRRYLCAPLKAEGYGVKNNLIRRSSN